MSAATTGVLQGRDILCFSHDWGGDPYSRTHLMRLLARENRVLWVNSIGCRAPTVSRADAGRVLRKLGAAARPLRRVEPNLYVLSPLALPFYDSPGVRRLNGHLLRIQLKRAMRRLGFQRPINWITIPTVAVVAGTLGEDQVIYHCCDENAAFPGHSARAVSELEAQLLRRADLVITSADLLYQAKRRLNPRTVLVRHGVDLDHFRRALAEETEVPHDIAALPRPILGYFGLIADWLDVELIAACAARLSRASIVLLGKVTTDVSALQAHPNVYLLGRKPYEELPRYCKAFDVALMPFRINELTLHANPLKVREYLAAGLPVVSTRLPEVELLDVCRIADDPESFVREIQAALAHPGPRMERSETVRSESWEARLQEIGRHLSNLRSEVEVA
jgi:glycosyltransferase involved in cell wall biosynthesis